MNQRIEEYFAPTGQPLPVDRQSGLIRGVKILGVRSRNGRVYPDATLRQAAGSYEQAKVNVNHPVARTGQTRDYRDRIGSIRNVTVREGEGLFADFVYNPKHPLAEQLAWDAQHAPESVGFSHNVMARVARHGEETIVEEITEVCSVDLVADPATTTGLFESHTESLRNELSDAQQRIRLLESELEVRRQLAAAGLPAPESPHDSSRPTISPTLYESLVATVDADRRQALICEWAELWRALQRDPDARHKTLSRDQLEFAGGDHVRDFVSAITY